MHLLVARCRWCCVWMGLLGAVAGVSATTDGKASAQSADWAAVSNLLEQQCLDCHQGEAAEAGLDLSLLETDLQQQPIFEKWQLIHDRVRDGEMPPPENGVPVPIAAVGWSLNAADRLAAEGDATSNVDEVSAAGRELLVPLAQLLATYDRKRIGDEGRSMVRRLNRFEYENTLRDVLVAPWLMVADRLPEDGVQDLFNKSGERLDVSHVQLSRYLEAAGNAIHAAIDAAEYPSQTRRFYAREEPMLQNYLRYRFGQMAATRAIVPLIGLQSEPDVIRNKQPLTVGDSDPERREREAMGVFSGVYSATTKYDFTRIDAPTAGQYRIRFKTYTFMAGPNGANGGDDHGLTGGNRVWWRPDRNVILPSKRSEPVTLYALAPSGDSRWLTTFDSQPEPTVFEATVALQKGEGIRPDAARLIRTRPGWRGNPNATTAGVPGFAMNWMEVEGPLSEVWPPKSYQAVLGELPFVVDEAMGVRAITESPREDAARLLAAFGRRCLGDEVDASIEPYLAVFDQAGSLGQDFTDSLVAAMSAMLCAPEFLYLAETPGRLTASAFRQRLAYFLWNGPADDAVVPKDLQYAGVPSRQAEIRSVTRRMLDDPRSDRFITAFLDYWLDLRDINSNTPDAALYPDYYLDELLTESSLIETRRFFRELLDHDLSVRNLIDSEFVFVNQRLAEHYELPAVEGVGLRRVELPEDSPRGGLLTQASVLRVTANGTTTSPVTRGVWVMERLLGTHIPPPPSGIAAVEPDIRGAKTIRQQLEKHRSIESCNACHAKFDPAGFGLESFDVAGGWRDRYRSIGSDGQRVDGFGKNGHQFEFKLAQPVECSGTLRDGAGFDDIRQLKRLLSEDQRQLARNLLQHLIVYSTGSAVSFSDRVAVENILDVAAKQDYGVRSLIEALVRSELFGSK
ncbi:DUF1588 domain-containing protein [Stieleria sp. TO1_6]|uniref:DUF1588 domain-containing protein n=1 Tax=Stieleria tagensis TaxID=2956795 RepID=UPI00209AAB5C|nr:DUF1588 domain-containing protein [Stieleria tagensis]MCO8124585.1 DUF1588 domain-containing protein [Stieleria tagensis]